MENYFEISPIFSFPVHSVFLIYHCYLQYTCMFVLACTEGTYGQNCASPCNCSSTNTKTCNPVNGSCNCKSGWTGTTCETDIKECNDSTLYTCQNNSYCVEEEGSHRCQCNPGFESFNGTCRGRFITRNRLNLMNAFFFQMTQSGVYNVFK